MRYSLMTPTDVVRVYLTHVLLWALFGAFAGWLLPTIAFVIVSHTEGLSYSVFSWEGFLTLAAGFGAFIGGATGIEAGQEAAYAQEASMKAAARKHPSVTPYPWGNPAWRPEHDDSTDYDYW